MPAILSPTYLAPIPTLGEKSTSCLVANYNSLAALINADGPITRAHFEKLHKSVLDACKSLKRFTLEREEKGVKEEDYQQDVGPAYVVVSPFVAEEHVVRALKEGRKVLRDVKEGKVELEGWVYGDLSEEVRRA